MPRTSKKANSYEKPYNTALYVRLSREDGDKDESNSVKTQKEMLLSFISDKPEFKLFDIYIDDGFSGTNFERPNFKRLESDIKNDKVNCIIVKDLSRLGRNYTYVGVYQDLFSRYDVRFIAINDYVDTANNKNDHSDLIVPIKNIFNEQYAHDISIKIRSALDTKRKNGEFIGAQACYGYKKDPKDKHHLIIDHEVSDNVKLIFDLFISGMSKGSIAKELNKKNIICPSEYKKAKGARYVNSKYFSKKMFWNETSVRLVLKNQIYTGDMVQHKQTVKSFKIHQNVILNKSDWISVPNTHEAIIDRNTWNMAQKILMSDTRCNPNTGNLYLFAGLIKCGDCGRAMSIKRNYLSNKYVYYICGTYRTYGKEKCSSHAIRYDFLVEHILQVIQIQVKAYLQLNNDISNNPALLKEIKSENKNTIKTTDNLRNEIYKLEKLKQGLYEDYKNSILDKEEYFDYKLEYSNKIDELNEQLNQIKSQSNQDDIIKQSKNKILKYQNITKLTREAVIDLIDSIYVYSDKSVKINFTFKPINIKNK